LAALSGSDSDVRREVERLLAHDKGNDFLDRAAIELYPEPANARVGSQIGACRAESLLGAGVRAKSTRQTIPSFRDGLR
jgi:hypothetical protein